VGHGRHADPRCRGRVVTALIVVIVVLAVVVVVGVGVMLASRRKRPDGVAAFQRHIDALSPEARRPVVDQVQQLEGDAEQAKPAARPEDDEGASPP
jgi:hypothetical protein